MRSLRLVFALALLLAPAHAAETPPGGPLPDIVQGSPSAPVTIVEYASMTCTHCAAFHATTWPQLKAKYIDTGRAKFILREFPWDPLAAAAFMVARCAGRERNALIDMLFTRQKEWAFVKAPTAPLAEFAARAGLDRKAFDACVQNKPLYDEVNAERTRAEKSLHIDQTPTFFIDGRRLTGEATLAEFDRLIAAAR